MTEEQPLSISERLGRVDQLTKQYGNIGSIPDDELNNLGYKRLPIEGGWTLRPLEVEKRLAARQVEQEMQFDEKRKDAPFGKIEVLASVSSGSFRSFSELSIPEVNTRIDILQNIIQDGFAYSDSTAHFIEDFLPSESGYRLFFQDYSRFLYSKEVFPGLNFEERRGIIEMVFIWNSLQPLAMRNNSLFNQTTAVLSSYTADDGLTMHPVQSQKLYEDLERQKGILADVPELSRALSISLYGNEMINASVESFNKIGEIVRANGLNTGFKFVNYFIRKYLTSLNLPELAANIERAGSLEEARNILANSDFSQELVEEEKNIKTGIRTASLEEKMRVSARLKEIQRLKKDRKQIKLGMEEYFSSPETAAKAFTRKIKDLQDKLIATKGEKREAALYLDATPDPELDKNPGEVSGDCTNGIPLPFNRPEIPLYNVKVYDSKNAHIGNIYLLVTNSGKVSAVGEESLGVPTWHMDAIQIPDQSIDWAVSLPAIIQAISEEAVKRDIGAITVNGEDFQISNYDYIRDAVSKYWEQNGKKEAHVIIPDQSFPNTTKEYSRLQGDGSAKVIWEQSNFK